MGVVKVIEVLSNSTKSWEDATQRGIKRASKSVNGIRSANVKNMSVKVDSKGSITEYRVNLKIAFEVK